MSVFCGIDWAEGHHDIAIIDDRGALLAKKRISETVEGFSALTQLLTSRGNSQEAPVPVAIETRAGCWSLPWWEPAGRSMPSTRWRSPATGNATRPHAASPTTPTPCCWPTFCAPTATSTDRCLTTRSCRKRSPCWPAPTKTRPGDGPKPCKRSARSSASSIPASSPHSPTTPPNLASTDARAILAIAPTPAAGATLTRSRIVAALKRGGRQRRLDGVAAHIHQQLRQPQLRHPPVIEEAFGQHMLALLGILDAACANVDRLGQAVAEAFRHPDHRILASFPGIGDIIGARLLGEIGDDRRRFRDARSLKAYAGSAPVTRASGGSQSVTRRKIKNDRLAATGFVWAFMAITNSPAARAHYDHRRQLGDHHAAALCHLFNRYLGQLHHCLTTSQTYNETKAFPAQMEAAA